MPITRILGLHRGLRVFQGKDPAPASSHCIKRFHAHTTGLVSVLRKGYSQRFNGSSNVWIKQQFEQKSVVNYVSSRIASGGHRARPLIHQECNNGLRLLCNSSNLGYRKCHTFASRTNVYNSINLYKQCSAPSRLSLLKNHAFLFRQVNLPFGRISWKMPGLQRSSRKPLFHNFGLIARAVSLAFARSHLPLGLVTLIIGGIHHERPVEAQPYYSNHIHYGFNPFTALLSLFEFIGLVGRSIFLLMLFMPAVMLAPMANMFSGLYRKRWLYLVRRTLEFAGAAFIKWGQWAATRPDLFPRDLCTELTKLHSNAPAHNFSYTAKSIENAFGKKIQDIFEDFEEVPVASGSIAQVHKATLRYSGSPRGKSRRLQVAVKVRHPGVSDVIRRDFIIINWVANLSTFIPGLRWLRLDESVRQFAVFMLTQVDLAREAAHLSRFLYNFRKWRDVSFPRPLYPLVHPAVLVETYEQGESVADFIELSQQKSPSSRTLAHIGTHTFLKMLLVDNFIHADMHPGNILVRVKKKRNDDEKGMATCRPHLVFLDVGLTAELSQKDRHNLLEFFKAVALRDGRTAAKCTLAFSRNQSCPNPDAFIKELESSFKFWGSREADVIHPGECMQDLLEQVRRHRVNIDGDVCTVMVTVMVLEGWQRRLDPDYNIMNTLQKLLFKKDWAESLSYTMNGIMAP